MDAKTHWNDVYRSKSPTEVSWYQPSAGTSMRLIEKYGQPAARIIDVGAGASALIDALLDAGYPRPVWLDVSAAALDHARTRLGSRASLVDWVVGDVTKDPALPIVDLWHDRAVLHFLTESTDQQSYARLVSRTVRPGGHVLIATFAPDGPERCSGLQVCRHDGQSVAALLGPAFELVHEEREVHRTPAGSEQRFCWSALRSER